MIGNALQLCADRFSDRKDWVSRPILLHNLLSRNTARGIKMKRIPLSQGKFALVDDEDYERLSKFKWCAYRKKKYCRVGRNAYLGGGRKNPKRKTIYMARQIMNAPSHLQVDHINHNVLDNRRSNLRLCTNAQNTRNRKLLKNCSSVFKGVHWHISKYKNKEYKGKWCARIGFNGQRIHIGYFESEIEAARAYDEAAKKLFGKFAYTNF